MRSRILRAAAIIALLTCFICPVLEMFDHWDNTMQTGQDTEYTLVVVALTIGAVLALARLIVKIGTGLAPTRILAGQQPCDDSSLLFFGLVAFIPTSGSPPLSLRI